MAEKPLCPLLSSARLAHGVGTGPVGAPAPPGWWRQVCLTEDCAWWNSERKSCAILDIADQLAELGPELSGLSRESP